MYSYRTVTNQILKLGKKDSIEDINQVKLQRLLYLVCSFHLAYTGKPLIREEFLAWCKGPALNELYWDLRNEFGMDKGKPVRYTIYKGRDDIDGTSLSIVKAVFDLFKHKKPYQLVEICCMTAPHKDVYIPNVAGLVIPNCYIEKYFKEYIEWGVGGRCVRSVIDEQITIGTEPIEDIEEDTPRGWGRGVVAYLLDLFKRLIG